METLEIKPVVLTGVLNPEELMTITSLVNRYVRKQGIEGKHPLFPFVSKAKIYSWLSQMNHAGRLEVYIHDYQPIGILGYDIVQPPWSDHKFLQEEIVFTLDPKFKGFGRMAVKRLKELADLHDCAVIATGDILNADTSMTKSIYMQKGGFTGVYPLYYKVM